MKFLDASTPLPDGTLAIGNTEDVLTHAEVARAARVALDFPKWTDGRAYSQATLLRGRLQFTGEIVATGDVLVDMLPLLARCGFSAVQLRADQNVDSARRALGFFGRHYQAVLPERRAPEAAA